MDKKSAWWKQTLLPIVGVFIAISGIVSLSAGWLENHGVNSSLLLGGNVVLFLIFLLSTALQHQGMREASTHVFLRNVYGGILLKLFGCAMAAFIYIYLSRDTINKPALFGCMFLYILYSVVELRVVLKKTQSA